MRVGERADVMLTYADDRPDFHVSRCDPPRRQGSVVTKVRFSNRSVNGTRGSLLVSGTNPN